MNYYKLPTGQDVNDLAIEYGWSFAMQNIAKYLIRAGKKDPTKLSKDVGKALVYLKTWKENFNSIHDNFKNLPNGSIFFNADIDDVFKIILSELTTNSVTIERIEKSITLLENYLAKL